jgi:hypothetical protein
MDGFVAGAATGAVGRRPAGKRTLSITRLKLYPA